MSLDQYKQIIAIENHFADTAGTLSATSEDATHVHTNVIDYKTATWWEVGTTSDVFLEIDLGVGNEKTADFVAIQGHNLADSGALVECQGKTDAGDTYVVHGSGMSPADNDIVFQTFDQSTAKQFWRIRITGQAADTKISNVWIGNRLDFPAGAIVGFTPPKYARADRVVESVTEQGQFAGMSRLSTEITCELIARYVPKTWVDANYNSLLDHCITKPVFFQWDNTNHASNHAAYMWRNGSPLSLRTTHSLLHEIRGSFRGRLT